MAEVLGLATLSRTRWEGVSRCGTGLILRAEDGRTRLLVSDRLYDIITLEPPHPRDAGVSCLYSIEFYELCRRRLKAGGMMVQWVPLFHQSEEEIRREIATFLRVFRHVSGWLPSARNLLLLGSEDEPAADFGRMAAAMGGAEARRDLADIGLAEPEDIAAMAFASREALEAYAGDAPIITDDRPSIEYFRAFGMDPAGLRVAGIYAIRSAPEEVLASFRNWPEPHRSEAERRWEAMAAFRSALGRALETGAADIAACARSGLAIAPTDRYLRYEAGASDEVVARMETAFEMLDREASGTGMTATERARRLKIAADVAAAAAALRALRGETRDAERGAKLAVERDPENPERWTVWIERLLEARVPRTEEGDVVRVAARGIAGLTAAGQWDAAVERAREAAG
ncbi:MAG: hypothetical protein N3A38_16870, partial [Planctomycetota bacterium]|nr:hypothetical protein [Planctomycetota bacterium]